MPLTFSDAPEVENIAKKLIADHHHHLDEQTVIAVFRSEAAQRGGHPVIGSAKKISGLAAWLADFSTIEQERGQPFFALVVPRDLWGMFDDLQRDALVDHLLSRCRVEFSENGARLFTVDPDGEFPDVVARYGPWRKSIAAVLSAAGAWQPSLFNPATVDTLNSYAVEPGQPPTPPAAAVVEPDDGDEDGAFGSGFDDTIADLERRAEERAEATT